jgi:hypothetical protein
VDLDTIHLLLTAFGAAATLVTAIAQLLLVIRKGRDE